MFMAFVDDMKIDMSDLDTHKKNNVSDARLYEHFCDFIRFHNEINQLSY